MPRFHEAGRVDLPRLTQLWQTAFGDPPEVIDGFWAQCFDRLRVFCLSEGQTLCAMACALPLTYWASDGEGHSCPYFYAVATAPAYRGRGLCRRLMAEAERLLQREGAQLCCLVPQSDGLFRFYEKLGYRSAFTHDSLTLPAQKVTAVKLHRLDADSYESLRQMQLYGEFVAYPDFLLELQRQAGERSGAGLYRLESQELVCIAAAEKDGNRLLVKELLPCDKALAAHLAYSLGCREVCLRTVGPQHPFGMAKALSPLPLPREGYLGLAFD